MSEHDALFAVTRIQKRIFLKDGTPVNHTSQKLLKTQDLDPVLEENSNFFIFSRAAFFNGGNSRLANRACMFEMSPLEAVDIDYAHEFQLAELIEQNKERFPETFSNSK